MKTTTESSMSVNPREEEEDADEEEEFFTTEDTEGHRGREEEGREQGIATDAHRCTPMGEEDDCVYDLNIGFITGLSGARPPYRFLSV